MQTSLTISLLSPILPIDKYAEITGQTNKAVSCQISEGLLPVVYLRDGKRAKPFIDMLALHAIAAKQGGLHISIAFPK